MSHERRTRRSLRERGARAFEDVVLACMELCSISRLMSFTPMPPIHFLEPRVGAYPLEREGVETMSFTGSLPFPSEKKQKAYRALPLIRQYQIFCAMGDSDNARARYNAALADLKVLAYLDGVTDVGIRWSDLTLVVGTEHIHIRDVQGIVRDIGAFAIMFTQVPPRYQIFNQTRVVHNGSSNTAHPHASQGQEFCMPEGKMAIRHAIVQARFSDAMAYILTALRMKSGTVIPGHPYSGLDTWPKKGKEPSS
jgi:hypothetical protein